MFLVGPRSLGLPGGVAVEAWQRYLLMLGYSSAVLMLAATNLARPRHDVHVGP
jgi:hypothetical protein